jgi:hypothetical protein
MNQYVEYDILILIVMLYKFQKMIVESLGFLHIELGYMKLLEML